MLKKLFKQIIVYIITLEARLVLKKYKPKIVGVTGSVGKTSTKDAIAVVLEKGFDLRKSQKSYNSELGVPLTILDCESGWLNILKWTLNILKGLKLILFRSKYPEWLVLEMGVEKPGDMSNLVSWLKPHVAVVTALSDIPSHVEFFASPEFLTGEKAKILKNLKVDDFVVLNGDDDTVYSLKDKTKARVLTYGFGEGADLIASHYHIVRSEGITFKVDHEGSSVPVRLFGVFGKHHVYSALAAMAVGKIVGFNLVDMSESLFSYKPPPGRLNLLSGVKNSFIVDDTYNSSPLALRAALDVMGDIEGTRKIAVLGDMLELGKYAIEAHKSVADYIIQTGISVVFTVGPRSKFTAEALHEKGFEKNNIFEFSVSEEAKKKVEEVIKEGDLILVKGSQSMRMEKIVEEIMAEPERKAELLIRQEKEWLNK